jgi:hypothetical protein
LIETNNSNEKHLPNVKPFVLLRCLEKKTCLLYDVEQSPPCNAFGKLLHIITTSNELSTTIGNYGLAF